MRTALWLLLGALGAAVVAGGGFLLTGGLRADRAPGRLERAAAAAGKGLLIPLETGPLPRPRDPSPAALARGRETYLENCAQCHGVAGRGAPLGLAMNPPVSDLTARDVQGWNDAELYRIVRHGMRLTGMPAWSGALSSRETRELVDYLRSLPVGEPRARS